MLAAEAAAGLLYLDWLSRDCALRLQREGSDMAKKRQCGLLQHGAAQASAAAEMHQAPRVLAETWPRTGGSLEARRCLTPSCWRRRACAAGGACLRAWSHSWLRASTPEPGGSRRPRPQTVNAGGSEPRGRRSPARLAQALWLEPSHQDSKSSSSAQREPWPDCLTALTQDGADSAAWSATDFLTSAHAFAPRPRHLRRA